MDTYKAGDIFTDPKTGFAVTLVRVDDNLADYEYSNGEVHHATFPDFCRLAKMNLDDGYILTSSTARP